MLAHWRVVPPLDSSVKLRVHRSHGAVADGVPYVVGRAHVFRAGHREIASASRRFGACDEDCSGVAFFSELLLDALGDFVEALPFRKPVLYPLMHVLRRLSWERRNEVDLGLLKAGVLRPNGFALEELARLSRDSLADPQPGVVINFRGALDHQAADVRRPVPKLIRIRKKAALNHSRRLHRISFFVEALGNVVNALRNLPESLSVPLLDLRRRRWLPKGLLRLLLADLHSVLP